MRVIVVLLMSLMACGVVCRNLRREGQIEADLFQWINTMKNGIVKYLATTLAATMNGADLSQWIKTIKNGIDKYLATTLAAKMSDKITRERPPSRALVGRMLTHDGRGPCGCIRTFDFCAIDLNTYQSICDYKCKNPSAAFKERYILYHGPCLGKPAGVEMDTTITTTDLCVNSNKPPKAEHYEWEPRTGSYYKFHGLVKTWRKALATCHAEGGYLAIINSQTEATVLKEIYDKVRRLEPNTMIYAFVGFYKYYDDVFATINGDTLAEAGFEVWGPSEPNNSGGVEYSGSIDQNGQLNDINGHGEHPFFCEITPK